MKNLKAKKNIYYDLRSDAVYIGVKDGIEEEYTEIAPGISVELNKKGQVVGIEILNASKLLKPAAKSATIKHRALQPIGV